MVDYKNEANILKTEQHKIGTIKDQIKLHM